MQGDNNMAPHDLVAPQPVESEVIMEGANKFLI